MPYTALYRRYRPNSFDGLVGQPHIGKILSNAIIKGNFVHAYLFCGPRGTGKTSAARILARAINCQNSKNDGNPCNKCDSCLRAKEDQSLDIIEIDGASNRGIDEIRDLRERIKYSPVQEKYKIYIIDEVHMLTNEAFNAILKTLEEPPTHVIFIFATTAPHKLPLTVLSRCQRFDFHRIREEEISTHLLNIAKKEKINISEDAIELIASKADGAMRDAITLLDQCAGINEERIDTDSINMLLGIVDHTFILKLRDHLLDQNIFKLLGDVNELLDSGKDLRQAVSSLAEVFRDGLLAKLKTEDSSSFPIIRWLELLSVLAELDNKLRFSASPRITLELAFIKACNLKTAPIQSNSIKPPDMKNNKAQLNSSKQTNLDDTNSNNDKNVNEILLKSTKPSIHKEVNSELYIDKKNLPSLWSRILKQIEEINISTFFRVENCRLSCKEEGALLLEFPCDRNNDFNYLINNNEQKNVINTAIDKICGKTFQFQCCIGNFYTKANKNNSSLEISSTEDIDKEKQKDYLF